MPGKAHEHKRKKENLQQRSEKGFIADKLISSMNNKDKIIMGLLVGGIVTLLILSIVILFGRGGKSLEEISNEQQDTIPTPTVKVLKTPYPTNPPVQNYLMQVNENRFYPDEVRISAGTSITIINIGTTDLTIVPTTQNNTYDFGTVSQGGEKSVQFKEPGIYRYTAGANENGLTVTVQ